MPKGIHSVDLWVERSETRPATDIYRCDKKPLKCLKLNNPDEDVEVLDRLYAFHVGIITNGAHDEHTDSQFSKVQNFGLSKHIQSLTISDEIGVRKPNTEIFKIACDRAGVLPREAIMVGDSIQNDIVGANKIGMTSVLIDRNSDVVTAELAVEQPDYTISNLYDVLSCLKQKEKNWCDPLRQHKK